MTVRDLLRLEFRPMNFMLKIFKYGCGKCYFSDNFDSEDDNDLKRLEKLGLLDKKVAMISFDSDYLKLTLAIGEEV